MSSQSGKRDPIGMTNDEMTREIYNRIVGDGSDNNPGLDKRMDRVEAKLKLFFGAIWVIAAAVLTFAANWILEFFQGKKT